MPLEPLGGPRATMDVIYAPGGEDAIDGGQLVDGSVTGSKLANSTVTNNKLAGGINPSKIVGTALTGSTNFSGHITGPYNNTRASGTLATNVLLATATVSAEVADDIDVTIQMLDINGNNLAEQCVIQYWLSNVAAGALTAFVFTGTGVSATTGTIIREMTTDTNAECITDTNGTLVLRFNEAGVQTLYFNLKVNNKYIAGSQAMGWT